MKILYVTTNGSTMCFFTSLIKELINTNNVVDIASNNLNNYIPSFYKELLCRIFQISTSRSPFHFGNIKAIFQIRKIAKDYDIIHCHTPLAGMATRLACIPLRKKGLKVIYTAHGFHFYNGAPLLNWIIYYPIEKICSYFTDVLITINKEDYEFAKKHMKAKKVEYVPGVGIDVDKYKNTVVDRDIKREELGIPKDAFVILSVGELNKNKNHQIVIKALGRLKDNNIHYVIAGIGNQKKNLEVLAKKLNVNLHLLGFRNDVAELYKISNINILTSIREGFGLVAIEGMAAGIPTICSRNRGTLSFGVEDRNCLFVDYYKEKDIEMAIKSIIDNKDNIVTNLTSKAKEDVKRYDCNTINKMVLNIYKNEYE